MFVPDGESRKNTAILLLGTAKEHGLPVRDIKSTRGGFHISDDLEYILAVEGVIPDPGKPEPEPEPVVSEVEEEIEALDPKDFTVVEVQEIVTDDPAIAQDVLDAEVEGKNRSTLVEWLTEFIDSDKTSGNRAAKKTDSKEE